MAYKKSFIGYTKSEVNSYIEDLKKQQENEKKALVLNVQRLNQELITLKDQRKTLKANYEMLEDRESFLEQNEKYVHKLVEDARRDAQQEVQNIINRHDELIERIIHEVFMIDEMNMMLKKELATISKKLEDVAKSISINSDVDRKINKVDYIINRRMYQETEEFDIRLLFDDKVSNIRNLVNRKEREEAVPKLSLMKPRSSVFFPKQTMYKVPKENLEIEKNPPKEQKEDKHRSVAKTALIVERNLDTAALLKSIIAREGYDVTVIEDGTVLQKMAQVEEPAGILIVDSMAPYIDISNLIKQIRSSSKWSDVPIMILSSESNAEKSARFLTLGATDFIEKPFNPRELVARLNRIDQSDNRDSLLKGG